MDERLYRDVQEELANNGFEAGRRDFQPVGLPVLRPESLQLMPEMGTPALGQRRDGAGLR